MISELQSQAGGLDEELISKLRSKYLKGKKFQSEASKFLDITRLYDIQEIELMAFLAKDAEFNKINCKELQAVQRIIEGFLLFGKIYSVLFSVESIDIDKLENGEYPHFEGKSLDKLITKCTEALDMTVYKLSEDDIKILKNCCITFRNTHPEKSSYLYSFFEKIASSLWNKKDASKSNPKLSIKPSSSLSAKSYTPTKIERMDTEDYVGSILDLDKTSHLGDVSGLKTDERLMLEMWEVMENEVDYETILNQLEAFKTKHSKTGKSSTGINSLLGDTKKDGKLADQAKCAIEAVKIKRDVEQQEQGTSYEQLQKTIRKMEDLGLPLKNGIGKTLSTWYRKAELARKEYYRDYEEKKVTLTLSDLEQINIEDLIEKNRRKPGYDEAKWILENLLKVDRFVSLNDEKEIVEKDIEAFEDWALMVREVVKKYSPVLDRYIDLREKFSQSNENMNDISNLREDEVKIKDNLRDQDELVKKDIDGLKTELVNAPLRRRAEEVELRAFVFMYEAVVLVAGLDRKSAYEDFDKILKASKRFEIEKDARVEKLVKMIKREMHQAAKVKKFVEDLKKRDLNAPIKAIQETLEEINNCQIILEKEGQHLEDYLKKHSPLDDEKKNSLKPSVKKVSQVGRDITNLPQMDEEKEPVKPSEEDFSKERLVEISHTIEDEPKVFEQGLKPYDIEEDSLALYEKQKWETKDVVDNTLRTEEDFTLTSLKNGGAEYTLTDPIDSCKVEKDKKNEKTSTILMNKTSKPKILAPEKKPDEKVQPYRILNPAKDKAIATSGKSSTSNDLVLVPNIPDGTILKIFDGSLEDMNKKEYQKIGFYTCSVFDVVCTIPQILQGDQTKLKIERRIAQSKLQPYLDFNLKERYQKSEQMVVGWIESYISIYQSRCDQFAKELLDEDMVAECAL